MPTIITITFNPAIDKSTSIPTLIPEKKLRCAPPVYEPGGGGVNVARAIKKLGGEARAVYLAGGSAGKKLTELLSDEFVESLVTETKESTRENLIVVETDSNKQYRFGMPGAEISEPEWQDCLNKIESIDDVGYIVASGSLPPGLPTDIFARIAVISREKNARLIVDTSGEALTQAVYAGVYLIKPNLRELSSVAGKEEVKIEEAQDVAREILNTGGCEVVVVSMGSAGAMLITKELALQIVPPPVKIQSTVGAGDSMVAGIVLSLAKDKTLTEAIQYGVACGTAATINPGTQLCRKEDALRLYNIIRNQHPSCLE